MAQYRLQDHQFIERNWQKMTDTAIAKALGNRSRAAINFYRFRMGWVREKTGRPRKETYLN